MEKVACISLLVLVFIVMEIGATDYCKICKNHTKCIYKGFGAKCSRLAFSGVTRESDKKAVENLHNQRRSYVAQGSEKRGAPGPQPAARNMGKLVWDNELASIAQLWADQCHYGHDTCRNVQRYNWVGQNVYVSGIWRSNGVQPDDTQDWNEAISGFYNEVVDFNNKNVDKFGTYSSSKQTGHYTQLVWAKTSRVGCGFSAYVEKQDGKDWYKKLYVCNYGPGGNVFGAQVYERGTT